MDYFCCDGLTCWLILTERLWKLGWYNYDYGCSLLMCLIKWLPVPFIVLGQGRRSVPPLCFSHSFMKSVVSGKLGSLLLPIIFVVCLFSVVSKKFLNGSPCLPWLWLIYPWSVGEPQDLTEPPYVQCLCMDWPFYSKVPKGLPSSPW